MSDITEPEVALLRAVRNELRQWTSFKENECDIEYDEFPPAGIGHKYAMVISSGVEAGEETQGGCVIDWRIGVELVVVIRSVSTPRDRKRDLFLKNVGSLNSLIREINERIDFQYMPMNAANTILTNESGLFSGEGFIEPLRFQGMGKPRAVGGEYFAGAGSESIAGLARMASYGGARYMKTRTFNA